MGKVTNFLIAQGTPYAMKFASQMPIGTQGSNSFLKRKALNMVCKADPSTMKQSLKMALDYLSDDAVASIIRSSGFCPSGGKHKTRKQKRKQRKGKTRKH